MAVVCQCGVREERLGELVEGNLGFATSIKRTYSAICTRGNQNSTSTSSFKSNCGMGLRSPAFQACSQTTCYESAKIYYSRDIAQILKFIANRMINAGKFIANL